MSVYEHSVHRRAFLRGAAGFSLAVAGLPLLAGCGSRAATVSGRRKRGVPRIAYLSSDKLVTNTGLALDAGVLRDDFARGLSDLGYIDGKTIIVDYHFTEDDPQRVDQLARDAVEGAVDVIVAADTVALAAAHKATSTIPIVAAFLSDPMVTGAVASLAHPGGNVTGLTLVASGLNAKELQIFKSAVPTVKRVGVVWNITLPGPSQAFDEIAAAAPGLGLQVISMGERTVDDFEPMRDMGLAAQIDGIIYVLDSLVLNGAASEVPWVREHKLPTICNARGWPANGGLMSYSADVSDLYRRVPGYVDRILKGARPAEMPVERPTRFELVINLNAARELGITIPESVLVQATEVIQ